MSHIQKYIQFHSQLIPITQLKILHVLLLFQFADEVGFLYLVHVLNGIVAFTCVLSLCLMSTLFVMTKKKSIHFTGKCCCKVDSCIECHVLKRFSSFFQSLMELKKLKKWRFCSVLVQQFLSFKEAHLWFTCCPLLGSPEHFRGEQNKQIKKTAGWYLEWMHLLYCKAEELKMFHLCFKTLWYTETKYRIPLPIVLVLWFHLNLLTVEMFFPINLLKKLFKNKHASAFPVYTHPRYSGTVL